MDRNLSGGSSEALVDRVRRVTRYALPYWATLAVVNQDDPALLELQGRRTTWLPQGGGSEIAELETLMGQGFEYLLVPSDAFPWLERRPSLKEYLDRSARVAYYDPETCAIFALSDREGLEYGGFENPDDLPLPPPEMVMLVAGQTTYEKFTLNGARATEWIRELLERHGLDMSDFGAVLDFGCGCGRVMRHWSGLAGPKLFGTDYNPYLVGWCRENLPFARFGVNTLAPELPEYADDSFDFVYALSIFTHLDEPLQLPWLTELMRIVRPGGYLVFTVHGESRIQELEAEDQRRLQSGQLVVTRSDLSGSSACGAYHPDRYVREELTKDFELVDLSPEGARDMRQDSVLVRKPNARG